MLDWIGKTLGRVQIESLLARGGMAEIYLGTHTTLQREVAVKILRNPLGDDPRPRERFELEARAVAKLRHPNIVQVFDFDTVDDQPYIVMEYIPGPSLSKYLAALHTKHLRLELPQIGRLLTGVASALQYAHESGVIHRDVKPGNILLSSRSTQVFPGETLPADFETFLTDFGLVRVLNASRQTTVGATAGTPAYMSPEQALGKTTDERTDIYSLGVVLYELLSDSVPFEGETTMSVLLKHVNEAPPPIPGLQPSLQQVLDRALAKNVEDRFQKPNEFAAAFNSALQETAEAGTLASMTRVSEAARVNPTTPLGQRKYWRPAILAGVLIALVGGSLLFNRMTPVAIDETPTASPANSDTPTLFVPLSLGPTGVLQFQNANDLLDQATLIAQAMPAPPADSHYEVWLVNGAERLPLGILAVDGVGRGSLTFDDPREQNLLAAYNSVEITVKPDDGSETNGSEPIAYSHTLPEAGLAYLRGLMVSFPTTPEQVGLIQGLTEDARLMDQAAKEMLRKYESGDAVGTKEYAESILNILVGDQVQENKDWNGDGQVTDPGDGYGFLLNGDHLGYIQAVYSHADYAVNAPGASRNIIVNGENVKVCTQNLARWTPELREQLLTILNATTLADMDLAVKRSATLVDQIVNGVDLNENGSIEPVSAECGVLVAYEYTYRMADMPLLPVNQLTTPTATDGAATPFQTSTSSIPTVTSTKGVDSSPATAPAATQPPANNPQPQNTKAPRPTKKPQATKKNSPP